MWTSIIVSICPAASEMKTDGGNDGSPHPLLRKRTKINLDDADSSAGWEGEYPSLPDAGDGYLWAYGNAAWTPLPMDAPTSDPRESAAEVAERSFEEATQGSEIKQQQKYDDKTETSSDPQVSHIREYRCTTCKKQFSCSKNVRRHQSSVHDKSRPFVCYEQDCPRAENPFSRQDNLLKHLRQVHNLGGSPSRSSADTGAWTSQERSGRYGSLGSNETGLLDSLLRVEHVELMQGEDTCSREWHAIRQLQQEVKMLKERINELEGQELRG
ncbi:hypothetical protein EDB80DRAFT_727729 [Ilyonectria destructans]|nr:hypothetical protein EDB80DRAFT_727729 [Ilyonectria destructans]